MRFLRNGSPACLFLSPLDTTPLGSIIHDEGGVMEVYFEVKENILDYLFVSYPCFNKACPGKILVSLGNLYRNTRTQCPICRREDSLHVNKQYLEIVQRNFGYLYIQLRGLELLPLAFSTAIAPKTVFLDSKQPDNTFDTP